MTMPAISKKTWAMLIIGVLALIAVWYFFLRKKKGESSYSQNLLIPGDESGYVWCWDPKKGAYKCPGSLSSYNGGTPSQESNWKMGSGDTCNCKPSKTGNCPCHGTIKGEPVYV